MTPLMAAPPPVIAQMMAEAILARKGGTLGPIRCVNPECRHQKPVHDGPEGACRAHRCGCGGFRA